MLKYLWMVTQDLFVTVTLTVWMHALLVRLYGSKGARFHGAFLGLGAASAVALAIVKNTTNKIVSSHWNHYIYAVLLCLTLAFLALSLIFARHEDGTHHVGNRLLRLAGSGLSATLIFYALPGVLLYPFSFNTMGNGYLSAYYMVRLAGWALGLLLLLIYARIMYLCAMHIEPMAMVRRFLNVGLLVQAAYWFGRYFMPWVNRAKWLKWPVKYTDETFGWIGKWMMFTADHAMLFIWLVVVLAAVCGVMVFMQNVKVVDPYDNPAQLRKLKAKGRHFRRLSSAALVGLLIFAGVLTLVKSYDTRVIELSAPETYTIEEDKILIPLDAVNDGHLHRFEYQTENGVNVRWIVVRKPNAASYGVGLDACEVCGNAGYFERNGQVVCKRCDVVMNINTIGFKGGCNPIPLAYEVGDGTLTFKLSDIQAGEKEFK